MPRSASPYPYTPEQFEILKQLAAIHKTTISGAQRLAAQLLAEQAGLDWPGRTY